MVRRAKTQGARYLSAADGGLLLRRFHEAIRLSSPVKFVEYLAAGLLRTL